MRDDAGNMLGVRGSALGPTWLSILWFEIHSVMLVKLIIHLACISENVATNFTQRSTIILMTGTPSN